VLEGYVTSNAAFPRDDHEEDDFCDAADPVPQRAVLPFRDTLTIDNAHDIDWIRFNLPSMGQVRIRTQALVPAVSDSTDIDLYLLTVPDGSASASLDVVSTSEGSTSDESISVLALGAGNYYVVVLDYVGVPTRYAICIERGFNPCASFPAPPQAAPAGGAPAKRSPARLPDLRPAVRP
jgi:hypothetical protein